ncbi:predicted protein [Uncinocarpus reesii 1704]|uniref:Protein kinase domain-containing protein n=1 Tax=Uncinocarpus reesii (strain UAMH 1704) TaxID=336963 RepID=C4JQV4_UNCRE|nr:uncharacterized protein UREG_03436 [Uncinocarpus reesii 1704]EEP78590.1 predicted protein [Uncinocarpus reesii 1704]
MVLERYEKHPGIRRLVDQIQDPPLLVLRYFDDNLLNLSKSRIIEGRELKLVARTVLQALAALHGDGFIHTDVKPDNILVNYENDSKAICEVALGDCGDACNIDTLADSEDGHIIGAGIFRSPEAMLNLKWGPPTDIWSFGTTLISLIWGKGWHIFKPGNIDPADEKYPAYIMIKQINLFGPLPKKFAEIADEERADMAMQLNDYVERMSSKQRKPFALAEDARLSGENREFICKIMKLDPRDRPTAEELLKDKWFNGA